MLSIACLEGNCSSHYFIKIIFTDCSAYSYQGLPVHGNVGSHTMITEEKQNIPRHMQNFKRDRKDKLNF